MVDVLKGDKRALRRHYQSLRDAIDGQSYQQKSLQLSARLEVWLKDQKYTRVLAYRAFRREVDLSPLALALIKNGYEVGLPKVVAAGDMVFYPWHSYSKWQKNYLGIEEPINDELEPLTIDEQTLVLVPALAMDQAGYRLGYGGGYYDRLLGRGGGFRGLGMGVVWQHALQAENLPREVHDVALPFTCTEEGVFKVR